MNIIPKINVQLKTFFSITFFITISLLISACSDPQVSNPNYERPVDYENSQGSIASNALVPVGPNGIILSPITDLRVTAGDSVSFSATANDPTGDTNISYLWDFDNVQANSTVQNPGLVTFLIPGRYEIKLTAINSLGQADLTADVREIIVESNSPLTNHEPIATIDSPVGNMTINVGDIVNFSGSGTSPDGSNPISFLWNFGDIPADNVVATPGDIQFTQAGEYIISLVVTDSAGLVSVTPALVTITVNPVANENMPPIGVILSPPSDKNITPGESIYFAGSASDADGNNPITYAWDFAGVIPESTLAIPDRVTFPTAGSYTISLITTDSLGLADPNPPQVTITVGDVPAPAPEIPVLTNPILSPDADMTINLGQTINFTGAGPDATIVGPLTYAWTFDGISPDSMDQNPGDIIFDQIGMFNITLTIADASGNVVTLDAQRTITVIDPDALSVEILEPVGDQTINSGESINFTASVTDPLGNVDFTALWTFDGAAPDSTTLSPGMILFETLGTFVINLNVTDPLTNRTAMAESRMITVVDPNALQNEILTPDMNQTINIGDILNFSGAVVDPVGSTALEYLWNFDGAAPNSTMLSPGDITFETAGTFNIQFEVSDPVDLRSAQSNVIEVLVLDPNALQANITSPANDMFIQLGDSIDFMGEAIDPLASDPAINPLSYEWDFGMPGITSVELNPGLIVFDTLGEFEVTFVASDPATLRESNPATRMIHVMPVVIVDPTPNPTPNPDPGPAPTTPQGIIESPAGDMTIAVGDVVVLEASGLNPINSPLRYNWNFNNGTLNLQVQNPGSVMFNTTGEYIITLIVSDENGLADPNPPSIVITVN